MRKLVDGLSVAVAKLKFAKEVDSAVRVFLDFIDPRFIGTAAYSAAQENRPEAMRLLHKWRADLDKTATDEAGGAPVGLAAQLGHTAMVQLLYDLGADVHRPSNDGVRPIHSASQCGRDKTVLLLLSLERTSM